MLESKARPEVAENNRRALDENLNQVGVHPLENYTPFARAMRVSRFIPDYPNQNRARAVHEWADAVLRALRGKS